MEKGAIQNSEKDISERKEERRNERMKLSKTKRLERTETGWHVI